MALGFSNAPAQVGRELQEISTEALGFLALGGENKVRLLPNSWPLDALPAPTSSLLSTAPNKGLVAAAGVDALVIASTHAIRAAFRGQPSDSSSIVPFEPQLKIPMPMRVSQVSFSADESYLVISAEQGGGLAVYDVNSITQGLTQSAFELSTNGVALRALLPNPTPAKAELLAMVTVNGDLLMANMNSRQFAAGPTGQALKQGVSCISWSNKGKQLVAGLGNGTAYQMTPEGEGKAEIPSPPGLTGGYHVSSISWLENDLFLMVHTPTTFDSDSIPESIFHIVTRQKPSGFLFQKVPDPCFPSGLNRSPPFQFLLRLKDFPPGLQDMLIVASTGSTDIGLLTRAKTPLTNELPANDVVDVFTTTAIADDTRRAQLPMTEDMSDTSPIGIVLDLSSKDPVPQPVAGEEIDQSSTPLPALLALNNDGVLSAWWIVYADSVRQGTAYPGLVAVSAENAQQSTPQSNPFSGGAGLPPALKPSAPSFGQPAFGSPAFPTTTPGSSASPQTGMFGSPSTLGAKPSVWAAPAAAGPSQSSGITFGKPSFGSPPPLGAAAGATSFGTPSMPGARASVWGSNPSAGSNNTASAFGQPNALGPTNTAPSAPLAGSGGFGSYANKGGFAAAAATGGGSTTQSIFAKPSAGTLGQGNTSESIFKPSSTANVDKRGMFSGGTSGFTLGSTFKGDGTAQKDLPKPTSSGNSFFGSGFSMGLDEAANPPKTPPSRDADMDTGDDAVPQKADENPGATGEPSTTPASTPAQSRLPTSAADLPGVGGTFGTKAQDDVTPASVEQSKPATLPFGKPVVTSADQSQPATVKLSSADDQKGNPAGSHSTEVRDRPDYDAKPTPEDAPLPPDFLSNEVPNSKESQEEPALPDDDGAEGEPDWEGSGEDVGHDLSPASEPSQSPKITPQSSFNDAQGGSPVGGLFTKVIKPAPLFPPPSKQQESPRSPSPIRQVLAANLHRPDTARSVSLPGITAKPARNDLHPLQSRPSSLFQSQAPPLDTKGERPLAISSTAQSDDEYESSDLEDSNLREELAAPLEATLRLRPFTAHQDYVSHAKDSGVGGQIERLYRDITSMIDTLGLNAKALRSFVKGHSEQYKPGGRGREDLDLDEDWCLVEIPELDHIQAGITEQLENGQIRDVQKKIDLCKDMQRDVAKLRAKHDSLRKTIDTHKDPAYIAAVRSSPLSSEQAMQQHEIRKAVTQVQKLITEAEEGITLLKAKLASSQGRSGKAGSQAGPTVEAVVNTILKMTSIAEKKSGDIDVLENQMRKMRFGSVNSAGSSREGSPFASSTLSKSNILPRTPRSSNTYGLFYTPESSRGTPAGQSSSFRDSTPASQAGLTRSQADVSGESIERIRTKDARKKEVASKLKDVIMRSGPRIKRFED